MDNMPYPVRTARVMAEIKAFDTRFPHANDSMILAWAKPIEKWQLELDDLLAAVEDWYSTHGAESPPMQVADLVRLTRKFRSDRIDRMDPGDRPHRGDLLAVDPPDAPPVKLVGWTDRRGTVHAEHADGDPEALGEAMARTMALLEQARAAADAIIAGAQIDAERPEALPEGDDTGKEA